MVKYSGTVIEAQPDWLTISVKGERPTEELGAFAYQLQDVERANGNHPRKWRGMGYEGLACGRVTYGQRDRFAGELKLSGDAAAMAFDAAVAQAHAITRLDLAVTWQSDKPVPRMGWRDWGQAVKFRTDHMTSAIPSHTTDAAGGFTLYLGRRGSEYYFREYNKEQQEVAQMREEYDGRYNNCWRFELEMKASVPMMVAKRLLAAPDRDAFCQGYIHTYMTRHGLTPPFDSEGGRVLSAGFRRRSDADTKLRHLGKNVKPTVDFLREAGRLDDALRALGLGPNS